MCEGSGRGTSHGGTGNRIRVEQMTLQEFAERTQAEHGRLIGKLNASADWRERRGAIDEMEELQQFFTRGALPHVGVLYPHQLVTTRPEHALVIAVRADINDTISRARALQSSDKLQKRIIELKKLGVNIPNVKVDLGKSMWLWVAAGLALAIFLGGRK